MFGLPAMLTEPDEMMTDGVPEIVTAGTLEMLTVGVPKMLTCPDEPMFTAPATCTTKGSNDSPIASQPEGVEMLSGETLTQREQVCAAWHELPDDLRKDQRLTRLYQALGGPRMDSPVAAIAASKDAAQEGGGTP